MSRRSLPSILALLLCVSCIPDLGGWRVLRPDQDGGPMRDAGRDRLDGGGPFVPCAEVVPLSGLYREGFEDGPAGWRVVGEFSSWQLGTPRTEILNRAAFGSNSWGTVLDGEYRDNEETYVYSPCFDASGSEGDLILDLWRIFHTEGNGDYAALDLSLDGGENWARINGSSNFGWYSSTGWYGRSSSLAGVWAPATAVLPGTARQPRVLLRMTWRTDSGSTYEGFAFDEVQIQPTRADLGVRVEQGEECGTAVVTVFNAGGLPIPDGFELTTVVDGVSDITTYDDEVGYRDEIRYEFGAPLARVLSASVFHITDQDSSNNQGSYSVTTVPAASFFRDFEADDGGLVALGNNSSWEWGVPAGTLISGAADGQRAWVTNLTGNHNDNEQSFLYTPCIDMRGLSRDAQISLSQVYRSEMGPDYLRVETSTDGGSFRTVGSTSSGGTNWYDNFNGWTGASGGTAWRVAQHPLTGTMGSEFVRIRFRMNSDSSQTNEGFGIDNLQVLP